MYQTNTIFNDIERWPLIIIKSQNLEYFIILFYFMISVLSVVCFNKLSFFHFNY